MAKGYNQKLKLLYLAKIFSTETDEDHGLTMPQIISRLNDFDVNADRKTLYLDFEELRHYGIDIVCNQKGNSFYYQQLSRDFELAELKLLVDSVQSAKFITEKKSRELIRKLESLVSIYDAKKLHRQVLISGRVKTMNESIYYNVDKLHTAINENHRIRFQYFHWNVDKKEEYRHDGGFYHISPWHLRWDDENYYLIGYDSAENKLKHYRVDKMKQITILPKEREGQELMKNFDASAYTGRLFGMFGGETTKVALEGRNEIVGVVIDRFGKDIPIIKKDSEHFTAHVEVAVSPQFLSWVAGIGELKVTSPESVVDQMKAFARRLASQYEI